MSDVREKLAAALYLGPGHREQYDWPWATRDAKTKERFYEKADTLLAEIRAENIADTAYVRISDVVDAIEAKDKTEERMMHDREYHIAMSDAVSVVRQLSTDD